MDAHESTFWLSPGTSVGSGPKTAHKRRFPNGQQSRAAPVETAVRWPTTACANARSASHVGYTGPCTADSPCARLKPLIRVQGHLETSRQANPAHVSRTSACFSQGSHKKKDQNIIVTSKRPIRSLRGAAHRTQHDTALPKHYKNVNGQPTARGAARNKVAKCTWFKT